MEPEQLAFASEASAWLADNVPRRWVERRSSLVEEEVVQIRMDWDRRLYAGGWAGLSLPVEYGGRGLGLAEEVLFGELAARAHAPDGYGRIGRILTAPTLIARGTDWQRSRYLQKILSGTEFWCQGFSEPSAGSDLAAVKALARRVEGGYRVTGQKIWTSFAFHADKCLFLARTDETAPRYRNLTMLLMDMRQPGIEIRPIRQISGGSEFAEVFVDDAFVAEEDRLGAEGEGWSVAMTVLNSERGGVEAVSRYVEMRTDIDLLLGCCAKLADRIPEAEEFETRLELVRWQVRKAITREGDERAFTSATGVLKVFWSELWQEMTRMGLDSMCPVHRDHWNLAYLDSRATTIYAGSSEVQRNIIGDRILGLPR
ncbi:acyl-CoA dehydrogenase family protein [Acrocarpospora catenulata]|uniref:acyl-CoA dehydrogenase family protein n=1 Tax=Acrocarpospora catenulata TaxID=2836182 RepID=UPI001BD97089|nr:acyl-CoA dehydrogenase family protein [Acrocarpospora catenulata]